MVNFSELSLIPSSWGTNPYVDGADLGNFALAIVPAGPAIEFETDGLAHTDQTNVGNQADITERFLEAPDEPASEPVATPDQLASLEAGWLCPVLFTAAAIGTAGFLTRGRWLPLLSRRERQTDVPPEVVSHSRPGAPSADGARGVVRGFSAAELLEIDLSTRSGDRVALPEFRNDLRVNEFVFEVITRAEALAAQLQPGRPVMICGLTRSGKSEFADRLTKVLTRTGYSDGTKTSAGERIGCTTLADFSAASLSLVQKMTGESQSKILESGLHPLAFWDHWLKTHGKYAVLRLDEFINLRRNHDAELTELCRMIAQFSHLTVIMDCHYVADWFLELETCFNNAVCHWPDHFTQAQAAAYIHYYIGKNPRLYSGIAEEAIIAMYELSGGSIIALALILRKQFEHRLRLRLSGEEETGVLTRDQTFRSFALLNSPGFSVRNRPAFAGFLASAEADDPFLDLEKRFPRDNGVVVQLFPRRDDYNHLWLTGLVGGRWGGVMQLGTSFRQRTLLRRLLAGETVASADADPEDFVPLSNLGAIVEINGELRISGIAKAFLSDRVAKG